MRKLEADLRTDPQRGTRTYKSLIEGDEEENRKRRWI
jgi:hypothetical protein